MVPFLGHPVGHGRKCSHSCVASWESQSMACLLNVKS